MKKTTDLEASRGVAALATVAEQVVNGALVDVGANFARAVHLIAGIANAAVRAGQVLAGAVRADVWVLSALVDICRCLIKRIKKLPIVRRETWCTVAAVRFARAERTELLEFFRFRRWAWLARRAPSHWLADEHRATATTRLGHDGCRWVEALTIPVVGVTNVPPRI